MWFGLCVYVCVSERGSRFLFLRRGGEGFEVKKRWFNGYGVGACAISVYFEVEIH